MSFKVLAIPSSFRQRASQGRRMLEEANCKVIAPSSSQPLKASEMIQWVAEVDGVIIGLGQLNTRVIDAAPKLRVISKHGVGVDNIDVRAATEAGIVVTNTPGANRISVAELAMGLMLALARRVPQHNALTKAGAWQRSIGTELADKKLGVVGLGHIGLAVARRARAFDMHVLYYDVRRRKDVEKEDWLSYSELDALLADSDFVSLHCPESPETRNMIGEAQLRAMKSTAYLINTARGGLIDEAALARALQEGWLAGAASDAFASEPPTDSPLLALDNFVATPHIGAITHESRHRMAVKSARNCLLVLRGQRPPTVLNPDVYETSGWQARCH